MPTVTGKIVNCTKAKINSAQFYTLAWTKTVLESLVCRLKTQAAAEKSAARQIASEALGALVLRAVELAEQQRSEAETTQNELNKVVLLREIADCIVRTVD